VGETIPENRAISSEEAAVVRWLLENGSLVGGVSHLEPSVSCLSVVGRCGCGCPSIDFVHGGQGVGSTRIAEGYGSTPEGDLVGLILWGTPDAILGLEVYGFEKSAVSMPGLATLTTR
jgi:hypothetical protein